MNTQAWDSIGDIHHPGLYEKLPPDLTRPGDGEKACWRTNTVQYHQWVCTRRAGHTGRHAAGDGARIRAVWS